MELIRRYVSCGEIDPDELVEFLIEDRNFPFKKILPSLKDKENPTLITEELKK